MGVARLHISIMTTSNPKVRSQTARKPAVGVERTCNRLIAANLL
jgi:hypothetical protein